MLPPPRHLGGGDRDATAGALAALALGCRLLPAALDSPRPAALPRSQASFWARGTTGAPDGSEPAKHPASKLRSIFGVAARLQHASAQAAGQDMCISGPTSVRQTAHVGIGAGGQVQVQAAPSRAPRPSAAAASSSAAAASATTAEGVSGD